MDEKHVGMIGKAMYPELTGKPRPADITDPCWDWQQRAFEAEREAKRMRAALEEIRDLARTGLKPDAFGHMTEEQWLQHKLNKIAAEASDALKGEG